MDSNAHLRTNAPTAAQQSPISPKEAVALYGHLKIDDVFTRDVCCKELGFYGGVQIGLVNGLKNDNMKILAELAALLESEFLRTPGIGRRGLQLARAVLARYHLRLGMEEAVPYVEKYRQQAE
ncbi:MAG TPA: hypothetical protein VJK53_00095 [Candidatus Paceibacterota bacterium]